MFRYVLGTRGGQVGIDDDHSYHRPSHRHAFAGHETNLRIDILTGSMELNVSRCCSA